MGDPEGGLVEDDVGLRHEPAHQLRITDIAFEERHLGAFQRRDQVLRAPPDEIIEGKDASATLPGQLIDDVRTDEPRAPGHQDFSAGQARQSNAPVHTLSAPIAAREKSAKLGYGKP